MGKSQSKTATSQSITNTTINQNLLYDLNKTMMNVSTSTLVNDAKECSTSNSQNNICENKAGDISDGSTYISNGDQSNSTKTDFTCVTSSTASNDMNSSMVQNLILQMKSLNGTDNAAALNTAAINASNSGSMSTSDSSGSSSTNSKISNNITNETITYIENIFEQNLNNNFSSETVDKCIGKTTQTNTKKDEIGNVTDDSTAILSCTQTNSSDQIQKCTLLSEAINKTLTQTASELGLEVVSESDTKTASESTSTASSTSTSTGIIQDTGTAISGIIDSVGDIITGLSSSYIISIVASVCVVLIVIIGIIMFTNSEGGKQVISEGIKAYGKGGSYLSNNNSSSSSSSSSFSLGSSSTSFGLNSSSTDSYFTYHGVNFNENGGIFSDTSVSEIIMTPNVLLTL
jgi:hypothetical protein